MSFFVVYKFPDKINLIQIQSCGDLIYSPSQQHRSSLGLQLASEG